MSKNSKNKSNPNPFDAIAQTSSSSKKKDPSTVFAQVNQVSAQASQPDAQLPPADLSTTKPAPKKRKRKKTGKSSDPTYLLTGVYIKTETKAEVQKRLIGGEQDLSDLVEELLVNWLAS